MAPNTSEPLQHFIEVFLILGQPFTECLRQLIENKQIMRMSDSFPLLGKDGKEPRPGPCHLGLRCSRRPTTVQNSQFPVIQLIDEIIRVRQKRPEILEGSLTALFPRNLARSTSLINSSRFI